MSFEVFIGWDHRQRLAWNVACASLQAHARRPVSVRPIGIEQLVAAGMWQRPTETRGGVLWDVISGLPCSTEFSIARFGVPLMARARWALFVDVDFLFMGDVWDLLDVADPRHAVVVVKHEHAPPEGEKMVGQRQRGYARKNWSSCVLWNTMHEANASRPWCTMLNEWHRDRLHAFDWLQDDQIGELPGGASWNWLDGHSNGAAAPKAIHFTRGTPDMPGYEYTRYAPHWNVYAGAFVKSGQMMGPRT